MIASGDPVGDREESPYSIEVEERKEGQRERFRELPKGTLVEHSNLADEALAVEKSYLGEVGDRLAILNDAEREVVAAGTRVADERDPEECLGIKRTDDQHGPVVVLAGAVELVADIDANGAPPNLACVLEGPHGDMMDRLLVRVPSVEIFLHTVR